ncbi:hypothetical protein [Gottfriedia acidiceleris]
MKHSQTLKAGNNNIKILFFMHLTHALVEQHDRLFSRFFYAPNGSIV